MARLRHAQTGVFVNVSDEKATAVRGVFSPAGDDAPNQSANKSEWVDYAVANGVDQDEAEDMTKAELQERFG